MDLLNATVNISLLPVDSCGRQQSVQAGGHHDSIWLTRISYPLFLIIGTVGNALGIVFVVHELQVSRGRRGPSDASRSRTTFLIALFALDLCYLWNRLVLLMSSYTWTDDGDELQFFTWTHGLWAFLDAILSFSSQGILVAFSVDRFYALTAPLQHQSSIRSRRRTSMLAVTFIFVGTTACSLIIPALYYWRLLTFDPKNPRKSYPSGLFYWRIFDAWFEVIIRLGSALTIVVLNRLIFFRIKQAKVKLSIHLHQPRHEDPSERSPMRNPTTSRASRSAVNILFFSSLFYLATNLLDIVASFVTVLSMYPLCLFQLSGGIVANTEPARDFLRHSYFAFSFLFYVCSKLRSRKGLRRAGSSAPGSWNTGSTR